MGARKGTSLSVGSSSVQDYVKAVYAFTEWQDKPITASQLAGRLSIANSSVTEMVGKLVELGLAEREKYGPIRLTGEGRHLALAMVRRHRLLETFLVKELGYRWDEVHDEAEVLEHTVSDAFIERLDAKLGRPHRDPHGDPIPTADGSISLPAAVPIAALDAGHRARLARVSDDDPEVLRYLSAKAVGLDASLTVAGRGPFGGSLAVVFDTAEGRSAVDVSPVLAEALWVESTETHPGCTMDQT
jgi:DtxR family Mn-dependent transcriptional regulator